MPLLIEVMLVCLFDAYDSLLMHSFENFDQLLLLLYRHIQQLEGVMK